MAFVEINPAYRALLRRHGLGRAEDFLALPAVIISGHPNRHVAQVTIGAGASTLAAYIKREHRVPWKDRLASAWAGFGWSSKSFREARTLRQLGQIGVGCPSWIAVGEDDQGRAFLLVQELSDAVDLRHFLGQHRQASPRDRRRFARALGETLARLHAAGFAHADLYSKHVLVDPTNETIHVLDWQRAQRMVRVGWHRRCRDLAALDATLADDLATPRERLVCLLAYLRAVPAGDAGTVLTRVRRLAQRFLLRRQVRELRQPPLATGAQNLIWLDGEALCVTREFWSSAQGRLPAWLAQRCPAEWHEEVTGTGVPLPGGGQALLVRRRERRPLAALWAWLRRRSIMSPELRQASALFRLQRHNIPTPRLLAVGQRHLFGGRTESFLLTEPPAGAVGLPAWLAGTADQGPGPRRQVLLAAAEILQRLHAAACYLGDSPMLVQTQPDGSPRVVLGGVAGIRSCRRPSQGRAVRDLLTLLRLAGSARCSRTDALRFLLGYLGLRRPTPEVKRFAWLMWMRRRRASAWTLVRLAHLRLESWFGGRAALVPGGATR
jgi:tRNA A-37 threonylcarbamoyl transferase component Bud32